MYRLTIAAAMTVAGLAFAAPPAVAEAPLVGPNCEAWIVSDAVKGIGAYEAAASVGLSVQEAQDLIRAGCADVTSNTPRCEVGHRYAGDAALERGDVEKWLFHLGAGFHCFNGEPAGPPA